MATTSAPAPLTKADRRRELGDLTRTRILRATCELLAERGEAAIRLRDITNAAQVNVAAVNYHFGSLKALYIAATKDATRTIITEATEQLSSLGGDATLEEIVAAWARPVLAARTGPSSGQRLAFLRITARAGSHPSEELCDWLSEIRSNYQCQIVARLRCALPHIPEDELRFRVRCAAGILDTLSSTNMQTELQDKDADELERLLVPVISGALGNPCGESRAVRPSYRAV